MISRQVLMSGQEEPPEHLKLDLRSLSSYLSEAAPWIGEILEASKFKGGQSNPTYKLISTSGPLVLRRKPPGKLIQSAHDIKREFKVLESLHKIGFCVPKPSIYCSDASIVGTEFYLVEYVPGRVFWEADLPGLAPADRAQVYDAMNAQLAALHQLDVVEAGLQDMGKASGYLARNFRRWADIYKQSELVPIAEMDRLIELLPSQLPSTEKPCLLHGDYGLYNVIFGEEDPSIRAILDWEMTTIGDPLVDLAHHLRAWWDEPDLDGASATTLRGLPLGDLGIPSMEAYVRRYCERRAVPVPDMRVHLSFAQFRYAAMIQGILKRALDGTASSRRVLHRQERVVSIARISLATLQSGGNVSSP